MAIGTTILEVALTIVGFYVGIKLGGLLVSWLKYGLSFITPERVTRRRGRRPRHGRRG